MTLLSAALVVIGTAYAVSPTIQTTPVLAGHWIVTGMPTAEHFAGAALGSDITIVQTTDTVSITYSYGRTLKLRLDGTAFTRQVPVAHRGTFTTVATARWLADTIVITTHVDRGTLPAVRDERVLSLHGTRLVVNGRRWEDGELKHTSQLTYERKN